MAHTLMRFLRGHRTVHARGRYLPGLFVTFSKRCDGEGSLEAAMVGRLAIDGLSRNLSLLQCTGTKQRFGSCTVHVHARGPSYRV